MTSFCKAVIPAIVPKLLMILIVDDGDCVSNLVSAAAQSLIIMSKPAGHPDVDIPAVFVSQKAGIIMRRLITPGESVAVIIPVRASPQTLRVWAHEVSCPSPSCCSLMCLAVMPCWRHACGMHSCPLFCHAFATDAARYPPKQQQVSTARISSCPPQRLHFLAR